MTTVDNPVEKVFKRWEEEVAKPICKKNYSMDMSKIPATFQDFVLINKKYQKAMGAIFLVL